MSVFTIQIRKSGNDTELGTRDEPDAKLLYDWFRMHHYETGEITLSAESFWLLVKAMPSEVFAKLNDKGFDEKVSNLRNSRTATISLYWKTNEE